MVEIITFAILVIVLNILDSTTTAICFKQYPDKELKGEGNPFMRSIMLKNKWLAEILKQGMILGLVIGCLIRGEIITLRIIGIMLGLVVLNNTYMILSCAITHRKIIGPVRKLQNILHLPDWGVYPLVVLMLIGLTCLIHTVVWEKPF